MHKILELYVILKDLPGTFSDLLRVWGVLPNSYHL